MEFFQQDLLVVSAAGNAPGSNLRAGSRREHDVHGADVGEFGKHSAWFAAEACFVTKLPLCFPLHVCQETHDDVSQYSFFFRVADWAN